MLETLLREAGRPVEHGSELLGLMLDRVSFLNEIPTVDWLFEAPSEFDAKLVKKKWKDETSVYLLAVRNRLNSLDDFTESAIESDFKAYLEEAGLGFGAVLLPLRIVLTGVGGGPSMFAFAAYLGKENTLARIDAGLSAIAKMRESN
jgi:glutamyl-tRNA synthetase